MKSVVLSVLLGLCSMQAFARAEKLTQNLEKNYSSAEGHTPVRTDFHAHPGIACIDPNGKYTYEPHKKITSGRLELTDVTDSYILYKLNVSVELYGVPCAFSISGYAPQVTNIPVGNGMKMYHSFVQNKKGLEISACAEALNLNESNMTILLYGDDKPAIVKGVDDGPVSSECGNLLFTADLARQIQI